MSNIWERLRYVLRGEKSAAQFFDTYQDLKPKFSEVSFESMVRHGYRKNELIFACISKTANSAAQVSVQLRKKKGKAVVEQHAFLDLIQRPNPQMGEFDLWNAVLTYQKLAGKAVFEKERNRRGQVIRLWPLRPDWLNVIPSGINGIERYEYQVPGIQEPITLRVEDVLDFKTFDPLNKYNSYPPVAVAARVGDVDNSTTDFLKLFFEKGGVPPGLLKTKLKLVDTQVEDIRRRWRERYGGVEHWTEPAVLDSDAEYQKTGLSFEEMGFEVLDARNEARICMVLDVPPILVGANVGLARATYSNYREARKAWWEDSLAPTYVNFQDVIQTGLVEEFGSDVYADWDFNRVAAFQEENNEKWRRATDALRSGGITVNQFQAEVGLPDRGTAGEVYLRPLNVVEVPAKGTGEKSASVPLFKVGEDKGAPDSKDRSKHERIIRTAMDSYFQGQLQRVTGTD
ncbi:hypothetical protein CCP3SC1AL1_770005 [Gammaproteobacteria bacterium]